MSRGASRDVRGSDGGDTEAFLSLVDERGVGCSLGSKKKKGKRRSGRFFQRKRKASSPLPVSSKLKGFFKLFHSLRAPLSASITSLEMFTGPCGDVILIWGVSDGRFRAEKSSSEKVERVDGGDDDDDDGDDATGKKK